MRRVLAVQHIWDDPPGYLGEIMQEYSIDCEVVQVDKQPLPPPTRYDAIIVLGGSQHANADDMYPYLVQEKQFIREVVEREIPYLGICLGGQLLALALGSPVTRHILTEIGFYEVQLTDEGKTDPLFANAPDNLQVIHWHEDTFGIPKGAAWLASSQNTLNQAFRYGPCAYGLQYHIELTPTMLDVWLHFPEFQEEIAHVLGTDALARIARENVTRFPRYREHSRQVFENFLRISGCLP